VLPEAYDMAVISRTLGRYTGLIEGLRTGDASLLAFAAGDELHETPRIGLNPVVSRLIRGAGDAGALHACWSGAGPSVLSFTTEAGQAELVAALEAEMGDAGRVLVLAPDMRGAI
jgi:homoserine kinase